MASKRNIFNHLRLTMQPGTSRVATPVQMDTNREVLHWLRAAQRRCFLTCLFLSLQLFGGAEVSRGGELEVELSIRGPAPREPVEVVVSCGTEDGRDKVRETLRVPANIRRARTTLSMPDDLGPVVLRATASGYWSHPQVSELPAGGPVRLPLWPSTQIRGEVLAPTDEPPISEVSIELRPVPPSERFEDRPQPEETVHLACPVAEDGRLSCAAPTGAWNVQVLARPWAPRLYWRAVARAERPLALGEVRLIEGGALAGRLVTAEGSANPATASVEVRPPVDSNAILNEAENRELALLHRTAEVDAWGHFFLEGIPPGVYELVADQPGHARTRLGGLTIVAGETLVLDSPVVLRAADRVTVVVSPPYDPFENPWRIRLEPIQGSGAHRASDRGTTDPSGAWTSEPLPRGTYDVLLSDGNDRLSKIETIDVERPDQVVDIELELVWVEGVARIGETLLEGRLRLVDPDDGVGVTTTSDENGRFAVVLPGEGTWLAQIASEVPPLLSGQIPVEVKAGDGLPLAEVEVVVPNTALAGTVVDEKGSPAAEAEISAVSFESDQVARTRSDADGSFAFRGLVPGNYFVEASHGSRAAEPAASFVDEDLDSNVRLVLRRNRRMAGRVHFAGTPVPHAQVEALPTTAGGAVATFLRPSTHTGLSGEFRLDLPARVAKVTLVVTAPGFPLKLVEVEEGTVLETEIGSESGTLRLDVPRPDVSDDRTFLVMVQGQAFRLAELAAWGLENGQRPFAPGLAVPLMPPGGYALCSLTATEAQQVIAGGAVPTADACSDGFLAAGSELSLSPPAP